MKNKLNNLIFSPDRNNEENNNYNHDNEMRLV